MTDEDFFKKCLDTKNIHKFMYGLGMQHQKFFYLRFEKLKSCSFKNNLIRSIGRKVFRSIIPYNRSLKLKYQVYIYRYYKARTAKALRGLLYLPMRGQRTRSNARTVKKNVNFLRNIFVVKAWQKYPFLTKTYATTAALAEYNNRIYKNNWLTDWRVSKDQVDGSLRYKKLVKFDLYAMSKFFIRIDHGEYKISKKTKQKKKVIRQEGFSAGLNPGFVKKFLRKNAKELRNLNIQFLFTKTSRYIKEKEKKTKKKDKGGKKIKSMKVARKMQKKKKKTLWD